MATFTPPVFSKVTPRFLENSTPRQQRLYKYMRPLDQGVNVYVLDDGTVVSDLSVVLSDASMSSTNVPCPWDPAASPLTGPPEGAEGGPYGTPPPYATVQNWASLTVTLHQEFVLEPHIRYWFAGGHGPYPNISANLVAILTAAKWDNYLS